MIRASLDALIHQYLVDALLLDEGECLNADDRFSDLGADSAQAVELKCHLEEALSLSLSSTLIVEYPTLTVLLDYLVECVTSKQNEALNNNHSLEDNKPVDEQKESLKESVFPKKEKELNVSGDVVLIGQACLFPGIKDADALKEQVKSNRLFQVLSTQPEKKFQYGRISRTVNIDSLRENWGIGQADADITKEDRVRLMLNALHQALNASAINIATFSQFRVGVFMSESALIDSGLASTVPLANLLSYLLNVSGPSETIQSLCTSGFAGIHKAMQAIQSKECDIAVVGAINLINEEQFTAAMECGVYDSLLSESHTMRSFDQSASGFIRCEGVGLLVLASAHVSQKLTEKPLAYIFSSSIAHGGRAFSLDAPNPKAMGECIRSVINRANVHVDDIDYVEAHGIGNRLADAIELNTLNSVLKTHRRCQQKRWQVGSIKPSIGHVELASGIASFMKAVDILQSHVLPGVSGLSMVNAELPRDHALTLKSSSTHWQQKEGKPRCILLNSYAIGGSCAALVVSNQPKTESMVVDSSSLTEKETPKEIEFNVKYDNILGESYLSQLDDIAQNVFQRPYRSLPSEASPMDYGFDSMVMIQFLHRVNSAFDISISVGEILTLSRFSNFIQILKPYLKGKATSSSETKNASSINESQHNFNEVKQSLLSEIQKGLWFVQSSCPNSTEFNVPILFQSKQRLNCVCLDKAFELFTQSTPMMRVNFLEDIESGEVIQRLSDMVRSRPYDDCTHKDCTHKDAHENIRHNHNVIHRIEVPCEFVSANQNTMLSQDFDLNLSAGSEKENKKKETIMKKGFVQERCWQLLRQPFNLASEPLIRCYHFTSSQQDTPEEYLFFVLHHIVFDGLSGMLFTEKFWSLYHQLCQAGEMQHDVEAQYSTLTPIIPHDYWRFIEWERQYLASPQAEASKHWWASVLHDVNSDISLPYDFTKDHAPSSNSVGVACQKCIVEGSRLRQLQSFSKKHRVNFSVILLSAYAILIHKLSSQADISIASPVSVRPTSDFDNSIGCFINLIVTRCRVKGEESLLSLLHHIKSVYLESLSHSQYPFSKLATDLDLNIFRNGLGLASIGFTYQNIFEGYPSKLLDNIDVNLEMDIYQEAGDHYALEVYDYRDYLQVNLKYQRCLFESKTIERHLTYWMTILDTFLESPEKTVKSLNILDDKERQFLLSRSGPVISENELDYSVLDRIFDRAGVSPHAVAVIDGECLWTYQQLCDDVMVRCQQLTQCALHQFYNAPLTSSTVIGVALPRSGEAIVTMLAIMNLECVYLPIDPAVPKARLEHIVEESQLLFMVSDNENHPFSVPLNILKQYSNQGANQSKRFYETEKKQKAILSQAADQPTVAKTMAPKAKIAPKAKVAQSNNPNSLAYIIYTSGSTGTPKGVMVSQRSLTNLSLHMINQYRLTSHDRILQFSPLIFDMSLEEIFPALLCGAAVVVRRDEDVDPSAFYRRVCDNGVTVLNLPPAFYPVLNSLSSKQKQRLFSQVRVLSFGGEALPQSVIDNVECYPVELFNAYGPSEYTVNTAIEAIQANNIDTGKSITIGTPISNTTCYILDDNLQLVPTGVAGELFVTGAGLAQGYVGQPFLTKKRFIKNPFSKGMLYKTGDIARWDNDGKIIFLGRKDEQIKIRGFRIELGEIESAYASFSAIVSVAAVVVNLSKVNNVNSEESTLIDDASIEGASINSTSEGSKAVEQEGDNSVIAVFYTSEENVNEETLKSHVSDFLPAYMVPNFSKQVAALPLTSNGKVDRKSLAQQVGLKDTQSMKVSVKPETSMEAELLNLWKTLLPNRSIGVCDDFFAIGGHSLLAIQLVFKINQHWKTVISVSDFLTYPSIRPFASYLKAQIGIQDQVISDEDNNDNKVKALDSIRILKPSSINLILPGMPGLAEAYSEMAQQLTGGGEVIALDMAGFDGRKPYESIESMAEYNIECLKKYCSSGHINLYAHSYGGTVALEMLHQLQKQTEQGLADIHIDSVTFLDSRIHRQQCSVDKKAVALFLESLFRNNFEKNSKKEFKEECTETLIDRATQRVVDVDQQSIDTEALISVLSEWDIHMDEGFIHNMIAIVNASLKVSYCLPKTKLPYKLNFIVAEESCEWLPLNEWDEYFEKINVMVVPGNHGSIVKAPVVGHWYQNLRCDEKS
ncbi:non-ribosomal peptide synthetase [Marinibactrum halimedae]|uniref:Amino acid adenylation domain-containing protein n=1 Tax=Marinibactrum halimedae TaxID=1444977 RepID=A0AA37T1H8_9GAMM|nr:non-ribosomal peptide synthetase [Marinibactrum halimedae]MCD9458748.1 amino acid adenylation domain-containing protein [Marinibactrum halimedae]GLS25305.1 hypothetical protein GCM10007877_10190 [Marinibactrum halimedae]